MENIFQSASFDRAHFWHDATYHLKTLKQYLCTLKYQKLDITFDRTIAEQISNIMSHDNLTGSKFSDIIIFNQLRSCFVRMVYFPETESGVLPCLLLLTVLYYQKPTDSVSFLEIASVCNNSDNRKQQVPFFTRYIVRAVFSFFFSL